MGHIFDAAADLATFVYKVMHVFVPGSAACARDGRHRQHCARPLEHKQAPTQGSEGLLDALSCPSTALVIRNEVVVQELLLLAPVTDLFVYFTLFCDTMQIINN